MSREATDGDAGIVLEPTDFRVATSTKGLAVYRIVARGGATHASQPDAGSSAIDGVGWVLEAVDATWERIQTYASSSVPTDHPLATCLRERSVDNVGPDGGRGDPWGIEAATDACNFVNDAGIPAVTWGPGRLSEAHTVDESIALADAETGRSVLDEGVRALLRGDVLTG